MLGNITGGCSFVRLIGWLIGRFLPLEVSIFTHGIGYTMRSKLSSILRLAEYSKLLLGAFLVPAAVSHGYRSVYDHSVEVWLLNMRILLRNWCHCLTSRRSLHDEHTRIISYSNLRLPFFLLRFIHHGFTQHLPNISSFADHATTHFHSLIKRSTGTTAGHRGVTNQR